MQLGRSKTGVSIILVAFYILSRMLSIETVQLLFFKPFGVSGIVHNIHKEATLI